MKLVKNALLVITGGVTIFLACFSCTKKDVALPTEQSSLPYHPRVGSFRSLTMPTVEDGMLVFDDQEHMDQYIDYLDAVIMDEPQKENESDTDTLDIDDKLQAIENAIGFTSLRQILVTEFELLNEVGFETLNDIPGEPKIASSSIRSVLNENYEVLIGGAIWVYYNENYSLEIADGNVETRNAIRALKTEYTTELAPHILFMNNVKIHGNDNIVCQIPTMGNGNVNINSLLDTTFAAWGHHASLDCEPYNFRFTASLQVTVEDPDTNLLPVVVEALSNQAQYTWNFGDGSAVTSGQNLEFHTYSTVGTYSARVTITYSGQYGNYSTVLTYPVVVTNTTCAVAEFDIESPKTPVGSSKIAYIRRTEGKIFGGTWFKDKIVSYTKSYKKISGNWKYRKVDRLATIMTGNRRDGNCLLIAITKAAWPYNSKCAEVVEVAEGYNIYNDDLHVDHRIWDGSIYNQDIKNLPIVCQ